MKKAYLFGLVAIVISLASFPFSGQAALITSAPGAKICTMQYAPVCGTNGVTYGNSCMADSNAIAYDGECKTASSTISIPLNPIYIIATSSAGINIPVPGTHKCMIKCLRYNPVCGVNGEEYVCGQAEASCNDVKVAHVGPCTVDSTKACMFSDLKSLATCTMQTEKKAFEKYLKDNINLLSTTRASSGTRFQITNIAWQPNRVALVSYSDGKKNIKAQIKIGVTYKSGTISKVRAASFKTLQK